MSMFTLKRVRNGATVTFEFGTIDMTADAFANELRNFVMAAGWNEECAYKMIPLHWDTTEAESGQAGER